MPHETKKWDAILNAIAEGVHARLELELKFSESITTQTVGIAKSLGIPDSAIREWADVRQQHLSRQQENRVKHPVGRQG